MKCSVFIATSIDGFIAKRDGSVDWLDTSGNIEADMGDEADMGFKEFIESVDCLIIGRGCMEALSNFDLTPDQWPYGNRRVIVLSKTLTAPPANLKDRVEMYSGDVTVLIARLEKQGYSHAYVDGGKTIQSFLDLRLINEITITSAPVILGEGIPLFGVTAHKIDLRNASVRAYPNDFIQQKYTVRYKAL